MTIAAATTPPPAPAALQARVQEQTGENDKIKTTC